MASRGMHNELKSVSGHLARGDMSGSLTHISKDSYPFDRQIDHLIADAHVSQDSQKQARV